MLGITERIETYGGKAVVRYKCEWNNKQIIARHEGFYYYSG